MPLTCSASPTVTFAPVVVKVATSAVTSVPSGTSTLMRVPLIVPDVPEGPTAPNEKVEIAFASLGGGASEKNWHPAVIIIIKQSLCIATRIGSKLLVTKRYCCTGLTSAPAFELTTSFTAVTASAWYGY